MLRKPTASRLPEALKRPTVYEALDRAMLQRRLLLSQQGLCTNAGLQRMDGLGSGATAKDLAYVQRRYLRTKDCARQSPSSPAARCDARNPTI